MHKRWAWTHDEFMCQDLDASRRFAEHTLSIMDHLTPERQDEFACWISEYVRGEHGDEPRPCVTHGWFT